MDSPKRTSSDILPALVAEGYSVGAHSRRNAAIVRAYAESVGLSVRTVQRAVRRELDESQGKPVPAPVARFWTEAVDYAQQDNRPTGQRRAWALAADTGLGGQSDPNRGDWSWKPGRPFPERLYKGLQPYRRTFLDSCISWQDTRGGITCLLSFWRGYGQWSPAGSKRWPEDKLHIVSPESMIREADRSEKRKRNGGAGLPAYVVSPLGKPGRWAPGYTYMLAGRPYRAENWALSVNPPLSRYWWQRTRWYSLHAGVSVMLAGRRLQDDYLRAWQYEVGRFLPYPIRGGV